ncbi:deoxynucleoside kinase [Shimia aestuarii]|uniref:deoxynucleoside kinase n=1 Tax=Shimia aestuarii TaxID=254406 RepID=UPI001FB554B6|nr:deoxynucleoside kinase [Shimia aestuarii]
MASNVAICGGIAVGKTTLGKALVSLRQDWDFLEERPQEVAFIKDFYAEKRRWAFHSRIGMLEYFFRRTAYLDASSKFVIQDRTLHELVIFAEVQAEIGTMSSSEFDLYHRVFVMLSERHPQPDVIIRCKCPSNVALKRVRERARDFEASMTEEYIKLIEDRYDQWQDRQSATTRIVEVHTDQEIDYSRISEQLE